MNEALPEDWLIGEAHEVIRLCGRSILAEETHHDKVKRMGLLAGVIAKLDGMRDTARGAYNANIQEMRERKHARDCHCNGCIGAPLGMPSEDIVYEADALG